ncbi:putative RNA-directed DNA polymerase [Rosa chinensis]|uniref:Putative RNA-directed DNA polymerase n=1 Tax=Rosa chinensis TaxID=74649 RepID=A0A2P6QVG2_ROSCH|nr:putative RNA-directed DNA polymerase [Rosa chinensis]
MQSEKQAMGHSVTTEFFVMAQCKQGPPPGFLGPSPHRPLGKPNPYANKRCIICGELGHSKERCYEVISYPDWWDFTKKPRKNLGKAAVATKEEVYLDNASANVAQSGMKGKVTFNSTWIIDTGASDHMTNDPSLMKNLRRFPQGVVSTADGTPTPVTGEGSIALSDTLTLESSDNGGEFVNGPMIEFCRSHGIRHQTSNSYTPQQNGLAERKNKHLMEVVRASLFGMNVPRSYWGEAVKSAAYLINCTPSRVIEFQNPHQKLHTLLTIPSMPNLEPRVFGCTTYVHIPKPQRSKLDPRARKCIFVGYAEFQKGYRCYDPLTGTIHEALTDPKWTKAMNEDLEALQKNATWELVPMLVGKKTVGCRWVFTVKLNADGTINRYKARLVAKGYTQRYGIDYEETFAPVAKINTVRILISLAANKDWPLHQFDVNNAFLNGNLEEEVYMDVPPGVKNYPSDVGKFEMKDLGQLKYFLGIEVARSKKGILLSQRKYVLDLLAETGMLDCRPMERPIEMNHRLAIYPDQVPTDKGRYQRLVGRLIYLSHTRPDIAAYDSIWMQSFVF